jgi:hypothetical protein
MMADPRYKRAEHRAAARERKASATTTAKKPRYRSVPRPCPSCDALSLRVTNFTGLGTPVLHCVCGYEELLEDW